MGQKIVILSAILLASASSAALAQDNNAAPVFRLPGGQGNAAPEAQKQGPELDVFRAPATQPAPVPPPVVPTTAPPAATPPAATVPDATTTTTPATPPAQREPSRPAPETTARPAPTPSETRAARQPDAPPAPANDSDAESAAAPAPTPSPASNAVASAPMPENPIPLWYWIIGVLLALAAVAAIAWRRRRSAPEADMPSDEVPAIPPQPHQPAEPDEAPAPTPPAPLAPPPAPLMSTPPGAPPDAPHAGRARIELELNIHTARLSLIGLSIGYDLIVRNRGNIPAEDILIHAHMLNANERQQAVIDQFFGGIIGFPVHSVTRVGPGEDQQLRGELRMTNDAIEPIKLNDRTLMIPIIAISAHYHWQGEDGTPDSGRTGAVFIAGQEQTPPGDRLAPFRLDLGPRSYPIPGNRVLSATSPTT